jgi:proline dehydrogenase
MGIFDKLAIASLPYVPTPIMRRLSSRYIAGEQLEDALTRLDALQKSGFPGVLDILGEAIASEAEARGVADAYIAGAARLRERKLNSYVSVKPTHVGLTRSEELCFELYSKICAALEPHGQFVRVEMEDHPTTDGTLRVFHRLRARFERVGIVLQSRLFRTPDDIRALPKVPVNVRMVKGIYLEPAAIAHTDPVAIRKAYVECTKLLLARGDTISFATHDEVMAEQCLAEVKRVGRGKDAYEFQVLMGVREQLWAKWRDAGHQVRVYVPFGADWRAYSQRRLRKNPQIFRHVLKDMFGLGERVVR